MSINDANLLSEQGVQSKVYSCTWNNQQVIVKKSICYDFLQELELLVWSKLEFLQCVHFCPILGQLDDVSDSESTSSDSDDLMQKTISEPGNIFKKIEFDNQIITLTNFMLGDDLNQNLSCIRQTLAAICILQEHGITHYDLHTDNVLITKTCYDVHVYNIQGSRYCVRTYGVCPVIIDFGLAVVNNTRALAPYNFIQHGFLPFVFDAHADMRTFLSHTKTQFKNLQQIHKHKKYSKYINIIHKLYRKVGLTKNGWLQPDLYFPNFFKSLYKNLLHLFREDILSKNCFDYFINILGSLVSIPVTRVETSKCFVEKVQTFITEWRLYLSKVDIHMQIFLLKQMAKPADLEPFAIDLNVDLNILQRLQKKIKRCAVYMSNEIYTVLIPRYKKYTKTMDSNSKDILTLFTRDFLAIPNEKIYSVT